MGFYIHSCKKMRYKGEYEPSELLCPTALDWHPYKESIKLIEKNKFSPLNKSLIPEFEAILVQEKVDKSIEKSDVKFIENSVDCDSHPESAGKNKNKSDNKSENKAEKNRRKKSKENSNDNNEIDNVKDNVKDNVNDCETAVTDQKPDLLEAMQSSPLKIFSPRFNYNTHTSSSHQTIKNKNKNKNDTNFTDSHITDSDHKELSLIPLDLGDGKREG